MIITDDIVGEKYNKLIRYAIDHSDAVMVVWSDCPTSNKVKTVADWRRELLELSPLIHITPEIVKRWEKKERSEKEALDFIRYKRKPFLESMSPFMIKMRHNTEWPSTIVISSKNTYNIALYRICKEIYPFLLEPGGYYLWRYPKFPEDLSFFKDNRCWLYASSHEEYLEFLPRSRDEYDFISSLDIHLDAPYKPIDDEERYWEDYDL